MIRKALRSLYIDKMSLNSCDDSDNMTRMTSSVTCWYGTNYIVVATSQLSWRRLNRRIHWSSSRPPIDLKKIAPCKEMEIHSHPSMESSKGYSPSLNAGQEQSFLSGRAGRRPIQSVDVIDSIPPEDNLDWEDVDV